MTFHRYFIIVFGIKTHLHLARYGCFLLAVRLASSKVSTNAGLAIGWLIAPRVAVASNQIRASQVYSLLCLQKALYLVENENG
jgi:hypothetical protein